MSDIQKQDMISDDNRFVGKRVLVTGTAQGIGQRIAQRFVQAGAEVIGLDRQPAAATGGGTGDAPAFEQIQLDVTDTKAIVQVCDQLKARWQTLDVLVNAAGVLRIGGLDTLTAEDWNACLDVNVTGPFHLIQQWAPVFKTQRRGAIVLGRVWGGGHERAVIVGAVPPAPVGINEEMRCGACAIAQVPTGKVLTTEPDTPGHFSPGHNRAVC